MAFRKLKYYDPTLQAVDPRLDPEWVINSTYCLVTITPYPTYKALIKANPAGISDTKMLGVITNYQRSEDIGINVYYDIGNASPIIVPGKFSPGSITLSSDIMECINLLGSMYETILENISITGQFAGILDQILTRPKLTETYFEDPTLTKHLNGQATAVKATPAPIGGQESPGYVNAGALLMSLGDIRLRVKFGLSFIILQSEKRLKLSNTPLDKNFTITTNDFSNSFTETHDSIRNRQTITPEQVRYQVLTGVFLENCIIKSYGTGINPNSNISSPIETVSIIYSSSKNIKKSITTQS